MESLDHLLARALLATGRQDVIRAAMAGKIGAVEALRRAVPERFDDDIACALPATWTALDLAEFVALTILGAAARSGAR